MARFVADLVVDAADPGRARRHRLGRGPGAARQAHARSCKGLKVAWYARRRHRQADPGDLGRAVRAASSALSRRRLPGHRGAAAGPARGPRGHPRLLGRQAHDATSGCSSGGTRFRTEMLGFMSGFDLIVSPVAPDIAPLYRAKVVRSRTSSATPSRTASAATRAWWSAPGTSPEGLPIGVQVVGAQLARRRRPARRATPSRRRSAAGGLLAWSREVPVLALGRHPEAGRPRRRATSWTRSRTT